MELKMKAICEGRKTRQDVVQETIEQYRAVYNRTQQGLHHLHAVRRPSAIRAIDIAVLIYVMQSVRRYVLGQGE